MGVIHHFLFVAKKRENSERELRCFCCALRSKSPGGVAFISGLVEIGFLCSRLLPWCPVGFCPGVIGSI